MGVKSIPLISDDDEHSLGVVRAAADMDELANIRAIAVQHRVTYGFSKSEFNELFPSANAAGTSDPVHEPVQERGDQTDLAAQPGVHPKRSTNDTTFR